MKSEVRRLVMAYGWNTTCYQLTNKGLDYWLASDNSTVVGYVRRGRVLVVAGAPVCPVEELREVISKWEAKRENNRACYFAAEQRLRNTIGADEQYSTVVLGAQPVWSPQSWHCAIASDPSLRAQLNRARNKGVTISEWDPANSAKLQKVLDEWLSTRGLPTLHFLVEPDILGDLGDRRIFVAERNGEPIAFVTMAPVPTRRGWLTEQFVRGKHAPNGTIELTLDAAIRAVGESGAEMITMGIVPLSHRADSGVENPRWLRLLLAWVRAHGRRFYNFDGLESFKNKFHPDCWE
jgi:phosphatidylglycerol lysyltransferase